MTNLVIWWCILTQRKPTRETDRGYTLPGSHNVLCPEPCSQVAVGEISIEATGEITPWRVSQAKMAENTNSPYVESIRSSLPMCSLTRWGCFSTVRPLKMMSACWRRPMALLTLLAVIRRSFQFVNHTCVIGRESLNECRNHSAVSKRDCCRGAVAYILIGISASFTIPADICRLSLASTCCPDSDEASQVCLRVAQTDYLDLKIIYCILFGFACMLGVSLNFCVCCAVRLWFLLADLHIKGKVRFWTPLSDKGFEFIGWPMSKEHGSDSMHRKCLMQRKQGKQPVGDTKPNMQNPCIQIVIVKQQVMLPFRVD